MVLGADQCYGSKLSFLSDASITVQRLVETEIKRDVVKELKGINVCSCSFSNDCSSTDNFSIVHLDDISHQRNDSPDTWSDTQLSDSFLVDFYVDWVDS